MHTKMTCTGWRRKLLLPKRNLDQHHDARRPPWLLEALRLRSSLSTLVSASDVREGEGAPRKAARSSSIEGRMVEVT